MHQTDVIVVTKSGLLGQSTRKRQIANLPFTILKIFTMISTIKFLSGIFPRIPSTCNPRAGHHHFTSLSTAPHHSLSMTTCCTNIIYKHYALFWLWRQIWMYEELTSLRTMILLWSVHNNKAASIQEKVVFSNIEIHLISVIASWWKSILHFSHYKF